MEAADSGARQSGTNSASSDSHQRALPYQPYRDTQDRQHQHQHQLHDPSSAMATAAVLHASAPYPSAAASYSSAYPQPPASNGVSTPDARKADELDPLKRQSLPSISEVISGTKSYPVPPNATAQQPNTSFPSPFTSGGGPSRSFTEQEKQPEPQAMRSASGAYPSRHETNAFAESPRQPFSNRPGGLPPVPDRRPSPISNKDALGVAHRVFDYNDSRSANGGYPQPPLQANTTSNMYPNSQLPPGQLPLPHFPQSPRYAQQTHGYATNSNYDQRNQPMGMDDRDRAGRPAQSEPFDTPSYQEALSRMAQSSRVIYSFSDAYSKIAHEQHGHYHFPERLPSDMELSDMIAHADAVRHSLEFMREAVARNDRAQMAYFRSTIENMKPGDPYDPNDDMSLGFGKMFDDPMKSAYGITEVKKRRGRAAPPGRCHSCNRVDTPEWRRGPDGARTLCNACGLHYAKLERKRQIEARSIRPKDERK